VSFYSSLVKWIVFSAVVTDEANYDFGAADSCSPELFGAVWFGDLFVNEFVVGLATGFAVVVPALDKLIASGVGEFWFVVGLYFAIVLIVAVVGAVDALG
jgi:hypothetical protein